MFPSCYKISAIDIFFPCLIRSYIPFPLCWLYISYIASYVLQVFSSFFLSFFKFKKYNNTQSAPKSTVILCETLQLTYFDCRAQRYKRKFSNRIPERVCLKRKWLGIFFFKNDNGTRFDTFCRIRPTIACR